MMEKNDSSIQRVLVERIAERTEHELPESLQRAITNFRNAAGESARATLELAREAKKLCLHEAAAFGFDSAQIEPAVRRLMVRMTGGNRPLASMLFSIAELDEKVRMHGIGVDLESVVSQGVLLALAAASRDPEKSSRLDEACREATTKGSRIDAFRTKWRAKRMRHGRKLPALRDVLAFIEKADEKDVEEVRAACVRRFPPCELTTPVAPVEPRRSSPEPVAVPVPQQIESGVFSPEKMIEIRAACDAALLTDVHGVPARAVHAATLAMLSVRDLQRVVLDEAEERNAEQAEAAIRAVLESVRRKLAGEAHSSTTTTAA